MAVTLEGGDVYEGAFWKHRFHGKGKMTYADGRIEKGKWKDGEFVGKQ